MNPYTVIYSEADDWAWRFFNCYADDTDHAEEQLLNFDPKATVLWINEGHNVTTME